MLVDRLVSVEISGMRSIDRIQIPLDGLTVLIGENGSGKSSILEAVEILRKVAVAQSSFIDQFNTNHGGLRALLRQGAKELRLAVRLESASGAQTGSLIDYSVSFGFEGTSTIVSHESLDLHERPGQEAIHVIRRDRGGCVVFDPGEGKLVPHGITAATPALTSFGAIPQPAVARVIAVLSRARVHVPIDVANCLLALNQAHSREVWQRVLELARAGLGTDPVMRRIAGELQLQFRGLALPVPASALSGGQLSYLALIALTQLGDAPGVLVLDEPETHLHPDLLVRAVWMLEEMGSRNPVIVATQSDRFLDALAEPAKSVCLCELDEKRATRLLQPDAAVLARWLDKFSGLGVLRAEGFARSTFRDSMRI